MEERNGSRDNVLKLSQENVEEYLAGVSERSRGHYRYSLRMFYSWLPGDKSITKEIMEQWRDYLQDAGYADSTINARLSACNNLMDYLGRRDLQITRLRTVDNKQPELSRSEYLSLLNTAHVLGRDTEYVLIKLFAVAGLSLEEVQALTLAGVHRLSLPDFEREEILEYARRRGREEGILFSTRSGKPIDRAAIRVRINRLAKPAQVSGEKVNPRSLQRLYRTTMAYIRSDAEYMVQRSYYQMLEEEHQQLTWPDPGWTERETDPGTS